MKKLNDWIQGLDVNDDPRDGVVLKSYSICRQATMNEN